MSPYPAQVNRPQIIELARDLIEESGLEALSLAKLAEALHIKAPSLYKHVQSKGELIREVNLLTSRELTSAILDASETASRETDDPKAQFMAMGQAYREFVLSKPKTYTLAFTDMDSEWRPDPAQLEGMAIPLQKVMAALSGEAASLTALRGAMALVHGFMLLEINNMYQRGGNLETAYFEALDSYAEGWKLKWRVSSGNSGS